MMSFEVNDKIALIFMNWKTEMERLVLPVPIKRNNKKLKLEVTDILAVILIIH